MSPRTFLLLALLGCHTEPSRLSLTGLYADDGSGELARGVFPYEPRFQLWSDGAVKDRWAWVPGAIDTSDPDAWRFPVGTKLWKQFTREGVRVETRMLHKVTEDRWTYTTYAWEDDDADATKVRRGVVDARGTGHDIPGESDCAACHDNVPDSALGFSAVQVFPTPEVLEAEGIEDDVTSLEPPGDDVAVTALGVLHANCGSCHNPWTSVDWVDLDLWLHTEDLGAVEQTAAYRTTVGADSALDEPVHGATTLVVPGAPEESALLHRMTARGVDYAMPPVGSEVVDEQGAEAVAAWITSLGGT